MHRALIAEQLNHAQYHLPLADYLRLIEEVREDLAARVEAVEAKEQQTKGSE
jgi:hypothetical protein